MVQRDGPTAAQSLAHRRDDRLQRIVPIAVPVRREVRARDDACRDDRERPLDVPPHGGALSPIGSGGVEERHDIVENRGVLAGEQVLGERVHRPEDDVAVRVGRPDGAFAIEEHEPLRPVAVGVLVGEDAQQQVAQRLPAAERQQQLDRTLAHVARAPAAAGVLLEPTRREVVDQGIVGVPGENVLQTGDVVHERTGCGRAQRDRPGHRRPEPGRGRLVVSACRRGRGRARPTRR